jgi:hypothetical protein
MTANVSIIIAHKDDVLKISNCSAALSAGKRSHSGAFGVWSKSRGHWWWRVGWSAGDGSHGLCFTREQSRASANQNRH